MNTPIYNIVRDKDDVLGLNPLVVYFFFTEETSRYKSIMANPCDNRRIFSFERLDKGTEMAHILQGTELGNAIKDCNMLVRLFTENGRNDEYFVANIPYEGTRSLIRFYARILMDEVYGINQRNISSRLEHLDENETDTRSLLAFVLDNICCHKDEIDYSIVGSDEIEVHNFEKTSAEIDESCYHFEFNPTVCFEICKPSPQRAPRAKRVKTEEKLKRERIRNAERKQKNDLLEQVKAKARQISAAAKEMEVNELERLLQILSGFNSSVEDSNDIAAGIFDEEKSEHLTYQICMSKKPDEDYDITVKVDRFENEGKQRKLKYGLIVTINDRNFYVHFKSTDSCMLYITTITRLKYNIALKRDDMIIKKNHFERKKKSLDDMRFMYDYLSNGSRKSFENWYLKMENFTNTDQDYCDQCHKKQENSIDGAISHANKDIFSQISQTFPKAMYYLGIINKEKENYQVHIEKDDIVLPSYFTSELQEIYSR